MEEEKENRWLDARMEECVWPSHDDDDACLRVHGGTRSANVGRDDERKEVRDHGLRWREKSS